MTRTVLESKTKTVVIGFDEPFCVIGERINPTGRKKLAAELEMDDFTTVLKDALEQVACGAMVLDVNSGAVFTNKMAADALFYGVIDDQIDHFNFSNDAEASENHLAAASQHNRERQQTQTISKTLGKLDRLRLVYQQRITDWRFLREISNI